MVDPNKYKTEKVNLPVGDIVVSEKVARRAGLSKKDAKRWMTWAYMKLAALVDGDTSIRPIVSVRGNGTKVLIGFEGVDNQEWKSVGGLRGDLTDTCIACWNPTDTGLATFGESEFHIAFLTFLGVTESQAAGTMTHFAQEHNGASDGQVIDGVYPMQWRVCTACIRKAKPRFPDPVLIINGAELPVIGQHFDE